MKLLAKRRREIIAKRNQTHKIKLLKEKRSKNRMIKWELNLVDQNVKRGRDRRELSSIKTKTHKKILKRI